MAYEWNRKIPRWTRWSPLVQTSPSGKILFVCLVCGTVSVSPNNTCTRDPEKENRGLDPHVMQAFPGVESCTDIERCINEEIEKSIADKLVLDWAEDQLLPFMYRNCPHCRGYGCQVCAGKGKRQ